MKFLNGWKTILGTLTTIASVVVPAIVGGDGSIVHEIGEQLGHIGDNISSVVAGAGAVLTLLGLRHRREKKTDPAVKAASEGTAPNSR